MQVKIEITLSEQRVLLDALKRERSRIDIRTEDRRLRGLVDLRLADLNDLIKTIANAEIN